MNIIATSLLRNRNHIIRPPMHPFDVRLLRRLPVVLLLGWGFFSMLGYMVLLYSLSDFGRAINLSTAQASSVTALLNLGTMLGRPCIGLLSDRYGRIEVAGYSTFACSVCVWVFWIPATSYALLVVFAVIVGGILGIFWMVRGISYPPFPPFSIPTTNPYQYRLTNHPKVYKSPLRRSCRPRRAPLHPRPRLRHHHPPHHLCRSNRPGTTTP